MKQSRYKSKLLWAAVAGQIISICQLTGLFAKYGIDAGMIGDVVAGILQVLTLVGILNDPTTSNKF